MTQPYLNFSVERFKGFLTHEFMTYVIRAMHYSQMDAAGLCVDEEALAETIRDYVESENKIVLLAKSNEKVIGLFMGHIHTPTFTKDAVAYETYTWVIPECRGHHVGRLMLDMFESWAMEKKCKSVVFGVDILVDKDLVPAEEMLKKSGYKFFEKKFVKVF